MQVEPISPTPPRAVGRTVFTQQWCDLAFVHWAVEPERVAAHLPPGVRPDVIDGVTYVALVPFMMRRIGLGGLPGLPYVGTFPETNVRLYGVDATGRRGVVFVSLEASRLATVVAARVATGLPYLWASMQLRRDGDRVEYTTRRRWPGPRGTSSRMVIHVGDPIEPGPLEHFLTARWGLHLADRRGRTRYWPNEHEPWPLRAATLESLDDQLLAAAGFPDLSARPPDSVLWSSGVTTRFGRRSAPVHPQQFT